MLPYPLDISLCMFFIYGFVGWIVEVIYYGITEGQFINRGFLNGPLCPVYGIGFYCVIWFFRPFMSSFPMLFFGSAIVCTTVELLAGMILYSIFHLRWWDYSDYRLNFKGFICVRFTIYWGITCSLGMYMLHPAVMALLDKIPDLPRYIILAVLIIILIVDIVVTVTAIIGFNKKVRFLSSVSGGIRKYSDAIGSRIYGSVDTIVTKTAPAVTLTQNDYAEFKEVFAAHRKEERELQKKNLAEERALLAKYMGEGKQGIANTSKAAVQKVKYLLPEIRLASRIIFRKDDENAESIMLLKKHYEGFMGENGFMLGADSDEELFEDKL